MKILYLYAELMGYQIPVFEQYVNAFNAEVHVVHWDHKKLTPYKPKKIDSVFYYNRSDCNYNSLLYLATDIKPTIVYVSGWMDEGYLRLCKKLRKDKVLIVAGSDTQVNNSIKQRLGAIIFSFFIKKYFTHIWVPGPYQYEYAKRLGFKKEEIVFNCLSADNTIFKSKGKERIEKKFLFLGRLEKIKGIHLLLDSWNEIKNKRGWKLTFIGNGSLEKSISYNQDVELQPFLQPKELKNVIKKFDFLILPSIKEPWGLVVHEAMSCGIPVLASSVCGSAPVLIIAGYSGFIFRNNDQADLKNKIEMIMDMRHKDLLQMSENAHLRSKSITPEIVASSFMSIVK